MVCISTLRRGERAVEEGEEVGGRWRRSLERERTALKVSLRGSRALARQRGTLSCLGSVGEPGEGCAPEVDGPKRRRERQDAAAGARARVSSS